MAYRWELRPWLSARSRAGHCWLLREAVFPLLLVYIFTCNRKSFERSRNTTILKIIFRS